MTQKFSPIVPKPTFSDKKILPASAKTGNLVEDKRKILEMELEKLRKQIKPEAKKIPRSYPSPAEKDLKAKKEATRAKTDGADESGENKVIIYPSKKAIDEKEDQSLLLVNVLPSVVSLTEEPRKTSSNLSVQQLKISPAYILYEDETPNETELYLLEDYEVK